MEYIPFQQLEIISWAGVAGLAIWLVIAPLIKMFVAKMNGKSASGFVTEDLLEDNHLSEIRKDIREMRKEQGEMRERIVALEVKVKKNNA